MIFMLVNHNKYVGGIGDTRLVGKFICYNLKSLTRVDDEQAEEAVEESQQWFYFCCFQRHRDPALTLHVPCDSVMIDRSDGEREHQLHMQVDAARLQVTTDFTMAKFFLNTMGPEWQDIYASPVVHSNIKNILWRVVVERVDADRCQPLAARLWKVAAKSAKPAKPAEASAATPASDLERHSRVVLQPWTLWARLQRLPRRCWEPWTWIRKQNQSMRSQNC